MDLCIFHGEKIILNFIISQRMLKLNTLEYDWKCKKLSLGRLIQRIDLYTAIYGISILSTFLLY